LKRKPNILVICTDQQRADTLGCYGNSHVATPNIDRLAGEGVLFENAFVQSPICSPSRGSFLTGRYPRTTRLRQNGQIIPPDEKPISKLLADSGYVAGLVGKFHLAPGAPEIAKTTEPRIDDGFSEFNWAQSPGDNWGQNSDYTRFLSERGLQYKTTPHELSPWVRNGMPEDATEAAWCATRACDFIVRRHDAPWFYLANIYAPHHPFDPPKSFLDRYLDRLDTVPLPAAMEDDLASKSPYQRTDSEGAYGKVGGWLGGFGKHEMRDIDHRMVKAAYWAMCDHVDQQVGRILAALDASGAADDTIVVYMSDHGEMLGDHNIYLKGPYFYDAAIRVPLIVRYGRKLAPRRVAGLFELVNLAPTLLEASEAMPYAGMQGRSALSWLADTAQREQTDASIYCEYYNAMPYHLDPTAQLTMLRTETHKIVVDHAHDDGELYNLVDDPLELRNLWRDPAALALKAELLVKLTHRMAFTADPLPPRLSEW
jgi:arylsulfatase